MARAKHEIEADKPLYERDFCLWVEEQVRLLEELLPSSSTSPI